MANIVPLPLPAWFDVRNDKIIIIISDSDTSCSLIARFAPTGASFERAGAAAEPRKKEKKKKERKKEKREKRKKEGKGTMNNVKLYKVLFFPIFQ